MTPLPLNRRKIVAATGGQRPRSPVRVLASVLGGVLAGLAAYAIVHWTLGPHLPLALNVLVFGGLALVAIFALNNFIGTDGRRDHDEPVD
ncbi:MAG: hypothetical protein ACJ798_07500 [Phenylobacterium sp.]